MCVICIRLNKKTKTYLHKNKAFRHVQRRKHLLCTNFVGFHWRQKNSNLDLMHFHLEDFEVNQTWPNNFHHSGSSSHCISCNCQPKLKNIKKIGRINIWTLTHSYFVKVHIFWEDHKILQVVHLTFDSHYSHYISRTKLMWWFRKILWPSQNTLVCQIDVHAWLLILEVKVQPTWPYLDLHDY